MSTWEAGCGARRRRKRDCQCRVHGMGQRHEIASLKQRQALHCSLCFMEEAVVLGQGNKRDLGKGGCSRGRERVACCFHLCREKSEAL